MKRLTTLLLAMLLCAGLTACGGKTEYEPKAPETQPRETIQKETEPLPTETPVTTAPTEATVTMEETTETRKETTQPTKKATQTPGKNKDTAEEPIQLNYELIGPWHLHKTKNDLSAFADSLDLFPGYGEWGASMEIRGNGEMSWYIGAEGWHGTYAVEKNILHARLTSNLEQSTRDWDFRITSENGVAVLEMDYPDRTIYWMYGDNGDDEAAAPANREEATQDEPWKVALAEDLLAKYGVVPKYYEDLGDGIYQVYVEIGGETVPFVAVNSATGDYHG